MTKNKKKILSRIQYASLTILSIMLLVLAAGCQTEGSDATEDPSLVQEEAEVLESPEPTTSEAEEMVELESEGEPAEVDQCLVCHTDQDTLMDTADPVVDKESESSGEG